MRVGARCRGEQRHGVVLARQARDGGGGVGGGLRGSHEVGDRRIHAGLDQRRREIGLRDLPESDPASREGEPAGRDAGLAARRTQVRGLHVEPVHGCAGDGLGDAVVVDRPVSSDGDRLHASGAGARADADEVLGGL